MHKNYSYLLVGAQFTLITLMLLFAKDLFASLIGIGVALLGLFIGLWALRHNRLGNFQILPELKKGSHLVTTGPYRLIRHPMYTSVIAMMMGVVIATPTLLEIILWLLLVLALTLKARREERLWMGHDPQHYTTYKQRTKLFLPALL